MTARLPSKSTSRTIILQQYSTTICIIGKDFQAHFKVQILHFTFHCTLHFLCTCNDVFSFGPAGSLRFPRLGEILTLFSGVFLSIFSHLICAEKREFFRNNSLVFKARSLFCSAPKSSIFLPEFSFAFFLRQANFGTFFALLRYVTYFFMQHPLFSCSGPHRGAGCPVSERKTRL